MTPFVTVIVPVRNEAAHIAATLTQLLKQCYDPKRFEILVVDGRSTDATTAIVRGMMRDHPQLQLFDNPKRLASAARNIGVQHARGDYLVIVDGHCEIRNNNYFTDLVSAFSRWNVDCLARPQPLNVTGATRLQSAIAAARASRLGHHPASHIYSFVAARVKAQGVAVAYRREVFDTLGLFDERFDACEDVEFNHRVDRAGMSCQLVPELTVHYRPRENLTGLFRQMQRYGCGRIRLLCKHADTFSPAVFMPATFFVALVLLVVISFAWPTLATVAGWIALVYWAVIKAAAVLHALTTRNWLFAVLLPPVLITIHAGAAWGVLTELGGTVLRWIVPRGRRWPVLERTAIR